MKEYTFDELERRHREAQGTLVDMSTDGNMVGSMNWRALQEREEELRMERLRRALRRDSSDSQ
jgi:hypothetical protein